MVSRQKYLDDLDRFLENCQTNVTNMLDTLGWTPDHFIQPKKVARCQYNSNHTMTPAALEKHEPVCELIQQGCSKTEAEKILDNSDYFYEGASCVYKVKIGKSSFVTAFAVWGLELSVQLGLWIYRCYEADVLFHIFTKVILNWFVRYQNLPIKKEA